MGDFVILGWPEWFVSNGGHTEPSTDLRDSIPSRLEDSDTPDSDIPGALPQVEALRDTNLESVIPRFYKLPTLRVKNLVV